MELQNAIVIDASKFVLGESITPNHTNGGFSPDSYGLNFIKEKGKLYGTPSPTDLDSSNVLSAPTIASTYDNSYLGNEAYFLDSSGNFYTLNGTILTKRQTDSVKTYQIGTSDLVQFNGNLYATSQTDIAQLSGSNLTAIDNNFWTTTRGHSALNSSYRHPMEVIEDTLYIADKNNIHTWNNATSQANAMSLPTDVNITSLRKHPDGRHLIAFCGRTPNYSHSLGGGGFAFIIDTINLDFISQVSLDAQVDGSRLIGGTVYVTYGSKFGYFTGSGIQWLKDLDSTVRYSHHIGSIEDVVVIVDGDRVRAFGDLGAGRVWWSLLKTSTNPLVTPISTAPKKLIVSYQTTSAGTGELREYDFSTTGTGGILYGNPIVSAGEFWVRRIDIDHNKTGGALQEFVINYKDASGELLNIGTVTYTSALEFKRSRLDCNVLASRFTLALFMQTYAMAFTQITAWYESAE